MNEDKSDVELEWQMVSVRNRVKKCQVPGCHHMKSVLHCVEVEFSEFDKQR